jgi:glycosyltransferase involved in cell wall biosynthesis
MEILFLTTIIFSQNCNGGEVASQCFIEALKKLGHSVTVVGYLRKGDKLEQNPQEFLVVGERYTETLKANKFYVLLWLALSFWKHLPYSSTKYYSRAYIDVVKQLIFTKKYDAIVIEHAQLGWIENFLTLPIPKIFIAQNIEYEIYEHRWQNTKNLMLKIIYKREAILTKYQEEQLSKACQTIWTLTDRDNKYFSEINDSNKTRTLAIAPDFAKLEAHTFRKCFDIGILGSWTWEANKEGLKWFLESVYPYLPVHLSIYVAGKGADWLHGKYPNIYYCGVVPNAQQFLSQAKVVAIPTLSGSGIQIKTLEAIASGSWIVATPVALRGISHPPPTVTAAETATDFASSIVSSVNLPHNQKAWEQTKNWYAKRRNQFLKDLAAATTNICLLKV